MLGFSFYTFFPVEILLRSAPSLSVSPYHTSTLPPSSTYPTQIYLQPTPPPPRPGKKRKKNKLPLHPHYPSTFLFTLFAITTATIPEIFYPGPSSLPLSPIGPTAASPQRFLHSVSYPAEQDNLILKVYPIRLLFIFESCSQQPFKENNSKKLGLLPGVDNSRLRLTTCVFISHASCPALSHFMVIQTRRPPLHSLRFLSALGGIVFWKERKRREGKKGEKKIKKAGSSKKKKQKQYSLPPSLERPSFLLSTHPFNSYSVLFLTPLRCVGLP